MHFPDEPWISAFTAQSFGDFIQSYGSKLLPELEIPKFSQLLSPALHICITISTLMINSSSSCSNRTFLYHSSKLIETAFMGSSVATLSQLPETKNHFDSCIYFMPTSKCSENCSGSIKTWPESSHTSLQLMLETWSILPLLPAWLFSYSPNCSTGFYLALF